MKTIVAIVNPGSHGKSSTVIKLFEILKENYPELEPVIQSKSTRYDSSEVFNINGRIIALEGQGDPKTNLKDRLQNLIDEHSCDLIVTTCRTRRETPNAIWDLSIEQGYEVIWTSNYVTYSKDKDFQNQLNSFRAKHLMALLQDLKAIPVKA